MLHVAEPWQTASATSPSLIAQPRHGGSYRARLIPAGAATALPDTSAINFVGGQTVNAVPVRSDENGDICYQGNE